MTDQVIIEFVADANFQDLNASLTKTNLQVKELTSSMAALSGTTGVQKAIEDFRSQLIKTGQYTSTFMTLESSASKFGAALERGKLSTADANRALKEYSNSATRASSQINRLITQQELLAKSSFMITGRNDKGQLTGYLNTKTGLDQVTDAAMRSRLEMSALNRVQQISANNMINLGKNAQWSGRQIMVGLTLPIGLFGAAAARSFYQVDQALTKMVKVYGDLNTNLSGDQIKELRSQMLGLATDLASSWGTTADVTLGVAAQMAAVGKQGADLLASTKETVRLSMLGDVDQNAAMQTILSLQSAFKTSTDQLANSINFLNAVENQTSLTLEDMTQAIPKAGPAVHALGGDVKELTLMLVAMREGGIAATQAANAIKTSLGRLIQPTTQASDYLKKFGIDLNAIVQTTQGDPVQTILKLKDAMKGMTQLQKTTAMKDIFGLQQYSRMIALFENIGRAGSQTEQVMQLMGASTEQLAQIANRELSTVTESASGKFNRALETAKLQLVAIGNIFLNVGTIGLNIFNKIAEVMNKMPDPLKNLGSAALIFTALFGPAKMLYGIILNLFGSMRSSYLGLQRFFKQITPWHTLQEAEVAAAAAGDKLENSMFSQEKAALAWDAAVKKLTATLKELQITTAVSGDLMAPSASVPEGRAQIASLLMANRVSGHTIAPDVLEKAIFGGKLKSPGRTLPQLAEENARQLATPGTFNVANTMLARIDQGVWAYGTAQAAAIERAMKHAGKQGGVSIPTAGEFTNLAKMMSAESGVAGFTGYSAETLKALKAFSVKYNQFFTEIESTITAVADEINTLITTVMGMTDEQAMTVLKAAVKELGGNMAVFDAEMRAYTGDIQSLAAQYETAAMMKRRGMPGINITRNNGTAMTDTFSRVGFVTTGMAAAGATNVAAVTLDQGVGKVIGTMQGGADKFAAATTAAAEDLTVATKSIGQKIRGKIFRGPGAGAAGLGLALATSMIPDTGNASIDNAVNMAGGVASGAMFGSMIAPGIGTVIGAVAGLATTGLPLLISKLNEAGDAMNASFSVGETAANNFGAKIKTITDIQMTDLIKKTGVAADAYQQFLEGFKQAGEGTEDKKFIDALTGADPGQVKELIMNRVAAGFAAGLNPKQLQAEILAALSASGNDGKLNLADIIGDITKFDPKQMLQQTINEATGKMATIISTAQVNMPGFENIPLAVQPGTPEYQQILADQQKQLDNVRAATEQSQEFQDALKPVADNLVSIALTMNGANFNNFIKNENLAGISANAFVTYIKNIPNLSDDVKNAFDGMARNGATTTQMLEALNLKSQGLIATWNELSLLPPAQFDIMFTVNEQKVDLTKSVVGPLLAKAKQDLANIKSAGLLTTKSIDAAAKKRRDARDAEKKAIKDRYDAEIKKIKDLQDAQQKAADAEAKRLDREKQLREGLVGIREAIANGDFAQAAILQNNLDISKQQWAQEDAAAAAKDKTQAAIDKLTAARDKETAAIENAQAADDKATQNRLDNIDKINAAIQKQNQTEINAAQTRVTTLENLMNQPWSEAVQSQLRGLIGSGADKQGKTFHDAFLLQVNGNASGGGLGQEIWDKVGGDLSNAPWDLIGKLADARINGDQKDIQEIWAEINRWNPTSTANTPTGGKGQSNNHGALMSEGGSVRGPGTSKSDSIRAWLSDGEFVQQASAVKKYGLPFMHAVNEGKFADGGPVGAIGSAMAKLTFLSSALNAVRGLFNPGTDAGSLLNGAGGSAGIVGSGLPAAIAAYAERFVGVPYSRTGMTPQDGWGCAPFVSYVYGKYGYSLPSKTLSYAQYKGLHKAVTPGDITAGDLLFFHYANGVNVGNPVNHVGMALNGSTLINAANPRRGTVIQPIDWANYVGARRVIDAAGKRYGDGGLLTYAQGGEFMMNRNAVSYWGPAMMNAMNNQRYHRGGMVTPSGPVRDPLATLGAGVNIHVYPSQGMDEEGLAKKVMQMWKTEQKRQGLGR